MDLDEHKKKLLTGAYLLVIGCLFLSSSSALIREALQSTSVPTALFLQFSFAFLIGSPWILLTARKQIDRKNLRWHFTRAIAGTLCFLAFYIAIAYIPLVNAVLLNNTAPLFIPLLLAVFYKKNVSSLMGLLFLLGFMGIYLILRPHNSGFNLAAWIGLFSGLGSAISVLIAHKIATVDTGRKALFYYLLFVSLLAAPLAWIFWKTPSFSGFMALIGAGFFQMCAQMFIIRAYSLAAPSQIAPLAYMTVVFSGLIGFAFFNQAPSLWAIFGIIIVILTGSLTMLLNHKRAGS